MECGLLLHLKVTVMRAVMEVEYCFSISVRKVAFVKAGTSVMVADKDSGLSVMQERERQVARLAEEAEEARADVEGRLANATAALDVRAAALSSSSAEVPTLPRFYGAPR